MTTFENRVSEILCDRCRVLLIANSSLTKKELHTLGIRETDIVVQFNKCIHAQQISKLKCKKVFVFSHNHLNSAFGFSAAGEPEGEVRYILENEQDIAQIAFTYHYPEKISKNLAKYNLRNNPLILKEADLKSINYPESKLPSVGFLLFSIFNERIRAMCKLSAKEFFIYCVGFKGRVYEEHEEVFHDFIFEKHILLSSGAFLHACFDK